jgi:hypothetical protein
MNRRRFLLGAAGALAAGGAAAALDAGDRTFVPRLRVGAIVKGATTPAELPKIYGADNVQFTTIHAPGGGQEDPGAFFRRGTPDALEIVFSEDSKRIQSVTILGKNWVSAAGLRVGASLAQLERLNGGPFQFSGFGWDYGGQVFARGRALKDVAIFIGMTRNVDGKAVEQVTGERKFSSRHPALKNLGIEVVLITVDFGRQ